MHHGSQGTKTQKTFFRTKIAQMAENALPTPKLDNGEPQTSNTKSLLSIMVLCIRMPQGSRGNKTQKSYFRMKIAQMAENAPPTPKLDQGAPHTLKLKRVPSIMFFYA